MEVPEKVRHLFRECFGFLPADEQPLSSEIDSLALIELALSLESEYSIFIDYDVCIGWKSLKGIISTVDILASAEAILTRSEEVRDE